MWILGLRFHPKSQTQINQFAEVPTLNVLVGWGSDRVKNRNRFQPTFGFAE
ncbi:hypothetical protein [Scytonema sp. PCC 10023]|uniref:hypothetical protein n=1 Tax=Scytonema sp. PCC 10023 TaxID=1680591 RepID=UPI0039C6DB89